MTLSRRLLASLATMACCVIVAATARAQASAITPRRLTIRRGATVSLSEVASHPADQSRIAPAIDQSQRATAVNRRIPAASLTGAAAAEAQARIALLAIPLARSIPFASPLAPKIFGFPGLDALDTAIGNGLDVNAPQVGFGIEPPDQGLCVGSGKLIEMTNLEFAVYDTGGTRTQGPLALSSVFGVPSSDFLSDPKCYYDKPTDTFYLVLTDLTDFSKSYILAGVMPANSTSVTTYQIPTTDDGTDGTPNHGVCPCFGDQPLLGADANAIFVSTNEFSMPNPPFAFNFNGAQIYAISKSELAAEVPSPAVFALFGPIPLAESIAASMQPATSPDGVFNTANGGTEFFMSSLDFFLAGDNRIAVWAMINTCIFASSPCAGPLEIFVPPPVLHTHTYMNPPPARQQAGPIPYGTATSNALESIDTGDDRMQQAVYANGKIYAGLNTLVKVRGAFQAGIEYFVVKPAFRTKFTLYGPQLIFSARLMRSGYVAHAATDIYNPSIGVTSTGNAVMAFSLSGASRNPSAGWMPFAQAGLVRIHFAAMGAGPDDGFTGYTGFGVGRWGDYSAAVADGKNIWMATEYIPSSCTDTEYGIDPLCGMTRAPEANWGTYISKFVAR